MKEQLVALIAESSLLLIAAENLALTHEDIVKWADAKIANIEFPPDWLIALSLLDSTHMEDYHSVLRPVAHLHESNADHAIAFVLNAYRSGTRSLHDTLTGLWKIWCGPDNRYETEFFPSSFENILIQWDCLDDLSQIPPELVTRCDEEFAKYRSEHSETMSAAEEFLRKIKNNSQQIDEDPTLD
ncbi:hypothetical protein JIN85_09545 [Luteolibacter pohnpeiensis]|uniref:Uncharacterized protein n=1 Tax=Luteolibacter pohnpeiensis TaxID=454153 RepID=A0A934S7E3_9BACT|nr:hypothetical protein [Luteolibacter pohnpeiensis]MBK1882660.1 hypothetical protein [Luteolibacter pohnpeiensis]